MANNSDGSIVLTVTIDKSELSSELSKLKSVLKNTTSEFSKTSQGAKQAENAFQSLSNFIKIQEERLNALKQQYANYVLQNQQNSNAAKKLKEDIKNLSTSLDENRKKLENSKNAANVFDKSMSKVKKATNSAIAGLKKFASALGIYLGLREIIRFSNEASKLASQQEANLKRLSMLYGEHAKEVYDFANANSTAFGMAKNAAYQAAADYGNLFSTFADGAESSKLTNDMLKATAVIASQTGRTYEDVFEKIRSGLYGNTRAIDDLGITVRKEGLQQTQAFQTVSGGVKKWNDLTDAELQHARALGIIEQAYSHYGNTVLQTTALTRSQFNAAWTDFKATWGQAVNLVLIPVLTVLTRILATITVIMQKIFHLTGNQLDTSSKVTTNIGGAVAKQDDLTDSVKKTNKELKNTNKELKKELASFDEIEILTRDKGTSSSGSGAGGTGGGGISTIGGGAGDSIGEPIINQGEIDAKLAAVAAVAGAALVGLGILVMLSGHPFYGLAMIGLGVIDVYAAAEISKTLPFNVKNKLIKMFDIAGKIAFMLGVILIFVPGCWKYGLGLMSSGVAALGYSTELGNGNTEELKTKVSNLLLITGIVAFMLGVILLFIPGCWKFGLGCMLKGAAAIGLASFLGGEELKKQLEDFCTKYWATLYGIGIIMICIGVALLFTPFINIALTLIGVGIDTVVRTTLLGGEELKKQLKKIADEFWVEIYVASALMLIIGILLCFTPAIGFGITLIVSSAAVIGTVTYLRWDIIKEQLTSTTKSFWEYLQRKDTVVAVLGTLLCFLSSPSKGLWCLTQGAKSLFGDEELSFENIRDDLIKQFKKVYDTVEEWVNKIKTLWQSTFESKVHVSSSGANHGRKGGSYESQSSKKISTPVVTYTVPALARGAVIPANREFLAVLGDQKRGTNIEAPAELIKQMAKEAIVELGGVGNQNQVIREEHYNLNETELMTIIYKLVKGGERLNGTSLVRQGGM